MSQDLKNTRLYKKLSGSSKDIRESRAVLAIGQMEGSFKTKLQNAQNDLVKIQIAIDSHTDLAASDSTSLRVVSEDFDADAWNEKLYLLYKAKKAKTEELEILIQIQKEQYSELNSEE